eukprot:3403804-Pyramimonas_sp.AAC.1
MDCPWTVGISATAIAPVVRAALTFWLAPWGPPCAPATVAILVPVAPPGSAPVVGVLLAPRGPFYAFVAVAVSVAVARSGTGPVAGFSGRAPRRSLARSPGNWTPRPAAQALELMRREGVECGVPVFWVFGSGPRVQGAVVGGGRRKISRFRGCAGWLGLA